MEKSRNIILQLFGCLMKNPLLLGEVNSYSLTPDDFSKPFEKQIFGAIYNLFTNGAERVTVVDIDNYLKSHEVVYANFNKENGITYLQDAEDMSVLENFNYYYSTLKKHNAIKDLKKMGFDTSQIYPEDLLSEDAEEKLQNFERMNVQMIFDSVREDVAKVESKYNTGTNTRTCLASEGIEELLESYKIAPAVGANLQGSYFNTVVGGARKGKFYIKSAGTGVGKTRGMVGDACYIAFPVRYSNVARKWEKIGSCEKVLYVGTEQTIAEIQTMILAYLSGINEDLIIKNMCSDSQRVILNQAVQVLKQYEENFTIVQLPDPTIQSVKGNIRKNCLLKEIDNVFYDYIFSSPGLLGEFRDLRIREDVMLGMLSTALKDIAVEMEVFLMSATQVNGDLDQKKGIRDQTCIRGRRKLCH